MPEIEFKGKQRIQNHHLSVPHRLLEVDASKSLNPKGTEDNLIIQGDNLHALKALMPLYAGKVKCIFIDPPYNTGNEKWKYNDNVNSPLMQEWLGKEVDGEDLERHDKWLCMMWPRLHLLKELLSETGVIFVSINDNEQHRLRIVMDEIFGEGNFVANFAWQSKDTPGNNSSGIAVTHSHVVAYRRSSLFTPNLLERSEKQIGNYSNPDSDQRGNWLPAPLTRSEHRDRDVYAIKNDKGRMVRPPEGSSWRRPRKVMEALQADNRIWWGNSGDADFPMEKKFLSEAKHGVVNQTWWPYQFAGSTRNAGAELKKIFHGQKVFDTPKPLQLLQRLLRMSTDSTAIVLDSFAGSGTTAHAVLALNKEDGGNRKFILVECEDYADNITAERVRRVIKGVPEAKDAALREGLSASFTYCTLGEPLTTNNFLDGVDLPDYQTLASHLLYTARSIQISPASIALQNGQDEGLYYETEDEDYYLFYRPDLNWLGSNDAVLDADKFEKISGRNRQKQKKAVVFAAGKFMGQRTLSEANITFVQLPYDMHKGE